MPKLSFERPLLTLTDIAIVGSGYVGLPLSLQFARSGINVLGLDVDPERYAPSMRDAATSNTSLARQLRTRSRQTALRQPPILPG